MWEDDEFYAAAASDGEDGEREKGDDGFDDYEEGGSGEKEGDEEEVSILMFEAVIDVIMLIGRIDVYDGHDAKESKHRAWYHRL